MENLSTSVKRISSIIEKDVDISRENGYIICSSDDSKVGSIIQNINQDDWMALDHENRYYIYIKGGSVKEISLAHLILRDKINEGTAGNFQQFLINILDGINQSKDQCVEFGIYDEENYAVYSLSLPAAESFTDSYSLICNSFYDDQSIWVHPYKSSIVLIQKTDNFTDEIMSNAMTIREMINSEVYTDVYIGIGSIHSGIDGIRKSYTEAAEAIEIGRMFDIPQHIYIYKDLVLERIIKQIPEGKIDDICKELFTEDIDNMLDSEMVKTIEVLFQNNLNISDSSKALYIHRNTLIYRLDKIGKLAGLDIKNFEKAVILKLILLLNKRKRR